MKNSGTILISAGMLLVGFSLFTPLLFFLIDLMLGNQADGSILLEMEYAFLAFFGLLLLIIGSIVSVKISPSLISFSLVALLTYIVSFTVGVTSLTLSWVITVCYYLSLCIAFGLAIKILHTQHPSQQ